MYCSLPSGRSRFSRSSWYFRRSASGSKVRGSVIIGISYQRREQVANSVEPGRHIVGQEDERAQIAGRGGPLDLVPRDGRGHGGIRQTAQRIRGDDRLPRVVL